MTAIAVDPSDSKHLLVGAAGGGVWESHDRGATWAARTDDQPCLGIGAVAFDPTRPSRAYAGTGEGNTLEVPGQGLLRSTDGGATWRLTSAATFAGLWFFRVVVDPADGNRLFAATSGGLFRSVDAGTSWTRVRTGLTWEVSLSQTGAAPGELLSASPAGVHRSGNGGATWSSVALPGGPGSFAGVDVVARVAVAHAPSNGDIAYVFAAKDGKAWLWRRSAAGGPFSAVPLPSLDPPGPGNPGYGVSQCWYDWCLAVAPADANTVFIGAVDAFRGRRGAGGGWSWTDISSRTNKDSIHPDQHTAAFDPSNPSVVYFGNDGGIFRSPDAGDSWQSLNKGLAITEFEYLAQHPSNRTRVIGGTQDNGTLRHRGNGIWDQIALGDGGDCAVEDPTPDTCYHSYYGMSLRRSPNGGDSWSDASPPVPDTYRALFYPPVEAHGLRVAKAGESVFVSDNEGRKGTWTEVLLPTAGGRDLASALAFVSDTRLLVGRQDGRVFQLDRAGTGWDLTDELRAPRPGAYLSDLLVDAASPKRYWVTSSQMGGGHVFVSSDGGAHWQDVTGNLPDAPVNAIAGDPKNPDTVWIATDVGVFQSNNRGGSWAGIGVGLPRALAVDVVFNAQLRLLRVGTRSRGVWELDVT